jgi:hypothetical protein
MGFTGTISPFQLPRKRKIQLTDFIGVISQCLHIKTGKIVEGAVQLNLIPIIRAGYHQVTVRLIKMNHFLSGEKISYRYFWCPTDSTDFCTSCGRIKRKEARRKIECR